jgi:hypothetical protein
VGKFNVTGVGDTDGIDVLNISLNATFPFEIFACHNGNATPCPVNLVKWEDITDDDSPDLMIDTSYWDPREAMLTRIDRNQYESEIGFSVFPNPSDRQTMISLELPAPAETRCVIYDVTGREVAIIFDGFLQAGKHEFLWNHAGSLQENKTGIYHCLVVVMDKVLTRQLICH